MVDTRGQDCPVRVIQEFIFTTGALDLNLPPTVRKVDEPVIYGAKVVEQAASRPATSWDSPTNAGLVGSAFSVVTAGLYLKRTVGINWRGLRQR